MTADFSATPKLQLGEDEVYNKVDTNKTCYFEVKNIDSEVEVEVEVLGRKFHLDKS